MLHQSMLLSLLELCFTLPEIKILHDLQKRYKQTKKQPAKQQPTTYTKRLEDSWGRYKVRLWGNCRLWCGKNARIAGNTS